MEKIFNVVVAVYLFIAAIMDIRLRKISNKLIAFGLILSIILCVLLNKDLLQSVCGLFLPLPLMFLYRLRKIGAADIKLLSVAGLYLGIDKMLDCLQWIMIFAIFLAVVSIAKAIWKKQFPHSIEAFPLAVAIALGISVGILGGNKIWEVFWQYVI